MTVKKLLALLLTACLLLGCAPAWAEAVEELPAAAYDTSVMTPWINSNLMGIVTDEVNADVKDDFFLAVNHDWLRDAQLRPGYTNETPLFAAIDTVNERCSAILNDESLTGKDAELVQGIYKLWLDWDGRNAAGFKTFEPMLEKILAIGTMDDLNAWLLSEENLLVGTVFTGIGLSLNAIDSSLYEIGIGTTGLSLGDPAEYRELTENGKRMQKANEAIWLYMLERIGIEGEEAQAILDANFDFESKVAAFEKTVLEMYDPAYLASTINPVTMDDLAELSPVYPLTAIMKAKGYDVSELINLTDPTWLQGFNTLYTEENLPGMRAYMLLDLLGTMTSCTDEAAYRKLQEVSNEAGGITESQPDLEIAAELARSYFPFCMDRLYIEQYLDKGIREEITQFCQDAIDEYHSMLDETAWLSEETREAAKHKLDCMTIHAVYPDKWEDDSMFSFTSKEDGGTYAEAMLAVSGQSEKRDLELINTRVDKEIWNIDILDMNAYYKSMDNSINIIPGFFCEVSYDPEMSIEEKYGALGTVIGHEISHAFDTNGAQFDADGNFADWWTEEDYAAFMARAAKLVDYYDAVVAFDDGTPYSGQIVQTEAIADMAGMKVMLRLAKKIDGFDYDKFFRANAKLWARTGTLEYMEMCALTDSHPLHYLRTNVTLPQYDEFYETYGIQEGDGMYLAPENRIAVW